MKMKKLNLKLVLVYLVTVLFFVNCENNSSEILVDTESISEEEAIALIVNGFVKEVIQELPMEFAVEAQKLISISLEGSVG